MFAVRPAFQQRADVLVLNQQLQVMRVFAGGAEYKPA